jgi:hypothetical protein
MKIISDITSPPSPHGMMAIGTEIHQHMEDLGRTAFSRYSLDFRKMSLVCHV